MPPKAAVSASDDVKFLLTVIQQMSGSIDWQKVTDELKLPSKGAAAKRYSRLPGKYEIAMPNKAGSATPDGEDDTPTTPKKAKGKGTPKKTTASAKKRKIAEAEEADEVDEDVDENVKSEVNDE